MLTTLLAFENFDHETPLAKNCGTELTYITLSHSFLNLTYVRVDTSFERLMPVSQKNWRETEKILRHADLNSGRNISIVHIYAFKWIYSPLEKHNSQGLFNNSGQLFVSEDSWLLWWPTNTFLETPAQVHLCLFKRQRTCVWFILQLCWVYHTYSLWDEVNKVILLIVFEHG